MAEKKSEVDEREPPKLIVDCQVCKGNGVTEHLIRVAVNESEHSMVTCGKCHGKGVVNYYELSRKERDTLIKNMSPSKLEEFRADLIAKKMK